MFMWGLFDKFHAFLKHAYSYFAPILFQICGMKIQAQA